MRGVWFGLCLLASTGIVFYTLVFGGPIATVILLALILLTLAEPSQPTTTPRTAATNSRTNPRSAETVLPVHQVH